MDNYLDYARVQSNFAETGIVDLGQLKWIYPTALLPSIGLLANNPSSVYVPPKDPSAAGYIETMLEKGIQYHPGAGSYVPVISLPEDERKLDPVLAEVYRLNNDGREYGGINAFKFMVGELVTNIYEHSDFDHAFIMAQKYPGKKFVDICFFDDGITIPGSLTRAGMIFGDDWEFIAQAVNGLSSKNVKERGYGLTTNVRICTEGLGARILIVSGKGVLYLDHSEQKAYNLRDEYKLSGSSISIRVPYPAKEIDIYAYQK
ncbi:MAG: hypothetical protein LLG16_01930 [Euryarchaeota archaeon]|nr:hypothetical protein [Euryarchaeota archaeon]